MRGHKKIADWIRSRCVPSETIIVLSDYIMTDWGTYLFNAFDCPYHFLMWNNYIKGAASDGQVREWIQNLLKQYKYVYFVFPTQLLGNPQTGECLNDWRPFLRAYPQFKPSFE